MTIIEGKGLVAPGRHRLLITKEEIAIFRDESEKRYDYRSYSNRQDAWGRGLMSGGAYEKLGPPIRGGVLTILTGFIGEYAVSRLVTDAGITKKAAVDLTLLPKGDGGKDFTLFGMKLDVKCRRYDKHGCYVKAMNDYGRRQYHTCDAFVFCEWNPATAFHIDILGWAWKGDVEGWKVKKAIKGNHQNYYAEDDELLPVRRLIDELRGRKQMESL